MLIKSLTFLLLATTLFVSFAPTKKIGIFQRSEDIGNPKLAGASSFDAKTGEYRLKGSGYNIWFQRDEFQYLFKKLSGDFTVTADFEFVGAGTDPHRKVGWMVRESMDDNASHISAVDHGDGLTVLQWRVTKGMAMRDPEDEIFSKEKNIQTIQMARRGNEYTMSVAKKKGSRCKLSAHTRWIICRIRCWWGCTFARTIRPLLKKPSCGTYRLSKARISQHYLPLSPAGFLYENID